MIIIAEPEREDYTFDVGGSRLGFVDETSEYLGILWKISYAELGPLGRHKIPVSAGAAWSLVAIALALAIGLIALLSRRRKKSS